MTTIHSERRSSEDLLRISGLPFYDSQLPGTYESLGSLSINDNYSSTGSANENVAENSNEILLKRRNVFSPLKKSKSLITIKNPSVVAVENSNAFFHGSRGSSSALSPTMEVSMSPLNSSRKNSLDNPISPVTVKKVVEELKYSENKDKAELIVSLKHEIQRHHSIPKNFDRLGFFKELQKLLCDELWEIRNESILLINDLLNYLGSDLDTCMSTVLPRVVPNISYKKAEVQESTTLLLTSYADETHLKQELLDDLIAFGINSKDSDVSRGVIENIIDIFGNNLKSLNLTSLCESLLIKHRDPELRQMAGAALAALKNSIDENEFKNYQNRLTPQRKRRLDKVLSTFDEENNSIRSNSFNENDDDSDVIVPNTSQRKEVSRIPRPIKHSTNNNNKVWVEYGIIDEAIMRMIRNEVRVLTNFFLVISYIYMHLYGNL